MASGSGQHAVRFATALPDLDWQPSDLDEATRRSITAHACASSLSNLQPPLALDVAIQPWPLMQADAIVAANTIHIAPGPRRLG